MKKFLISILFLGIFAIPAIADNQDNNIQTKSTQKITIKTFFSDRFNNKADKIIKNKLFTISIPRELDKSYKIKKSDKNISIYDKVSAKAGFIGFAFGIYAFKNPADYATFPGYKKIGELTDKKNDIYDIVLVQPTDVQYDYIHDIKESYFKLYDLADGIEIKGTKSTQYHKEQGTKGKDLYKKILQKHVVAAKENWNSEKLKQSNMSDAYSDKNIADKIGYIYYDLNADGIEELLIGEISDNNVKGIIYDIYTMVNRQPMHVVSGNNSKNKYFVCCESFICNEQSNDTETYWNTYFLVENSTELFPQIWFKKTYDKKSNKTSWYKSYNPQKEQWENISQQDFQNGILRFTQYKNLEYKPLKELW